MASGSTTFTKIVNKWNTALIGLMTYQGVSCQHSRAAGFVGEMRKQGIQLQL